MKSVAIAHQYMELIVRPGGESRRPFTKENVFFKFNLINSQTQKELLHSVKLLPVKNGQQPVPTGFPFHVFLIKNEYQNSSYPVWHIVNKGSSFTGTKGTYLS